MSCPLSAGSCHWDQHQNLHLVISESARVILKPGSGRDGYFTSEKVVKQLRDAIKIVEETYPDYTHVFIYDNAPSHTKRPDDAISARRMPKKAVPEFPRSFINSQGKKIQPPPMEPGRLPNGTPQSFYYPSDHSAMPNWFKGMAKILQERDLGHIAEKLAQCPGFKCEGGRTDCCCRRALLSQPDFDSRDSTLEEVARGLGSRVLFLPKYHCELNPIEQCWGYAKKRYREMPHTNKESVMEKYVVDAINSVPIESIRKFAARAQRFVDAYASGKRGPQAINWATKEFWSHRQTPAHILFDQICT